MSREEQAPRPENQTETPAHGVVDVGTACVVHGFREAVFSRAERHAQSLGDNYRAAGDRLREQLKEQQEQAVKSVDAFIDQLNAFQKEALTAIEKELRQLRETTVTITGETQSVRSDLEKASRDLKTAIDDWEQRHKGTFQALERFQKEYRGTIETFDAATKRVENIVTNHTSLSTTSILSVFFGALLGSGMGVFLVLHFLG